ncbi:MAG TPA: PIG-L family deacetylase [Pyrinomonadaceae bacterium]|nr:PIG-L family deacetylase [Pyrinomonadaceae bacterium]
MTLAIRPAKLTRRRSPHARLFGTGELAPGTRCAVIVAHPADEIVGAGCLISKLVDVSILHVTDGVAVENAERAKRTQEVDALRQQCLMALAVANVPKDRIIDLWVPDHRAANQLADLTKRITTFLQQTGADIVLTHPYEGGHPDHDATSFASHAAVRLMIESGLRPPVIFELGLYPSNDEQNKITGFLPGSNGEVTTLVLDDRSRELKQRMVACLNGHGKHLNGAAIDSERFRRPPKYDFSVPPRKGKLHYENFDWAISAREWQALAGKALTQLFSQPRNRQTGEPPNRECKMPGK